MLIYNEFELTKKYLFKLSGKQELMSDYPIEQLSIQMRERIVLPLSTIQQFAIVKYLGSRKIGLPVENDLRKIDHPLFLWNYQCRQELSLRILPTFVV